MLNIINHMPKNKSDRPSLLFVHGAWHSAWCWDEFYLPYFAQQGYASYALDLRGHGKSPNSKSLRFTSIGDYVEDVATAVDQIGGDVVVIGHSMGGMIVQKYLKTKHKAKAGVLMATVPWYGELKGIWLFLTTMPFKLLKMLFTMSTFPLVEDQAKAAYLFLDADASAQDKQKYMSQLQNEAYWAFLQLVAQSFGKISVPILVISGEDDKIISPKSQHTTAEHYGGTCHIVKDTPHDLMLSKSWKKSAKLIETWLNNRP